MNKLERIRIHTPAFKNLLERYHVSVRQLGQSDMVGKSPRTIRKYMEEGAFPPELLARIMMHILTVSGRTTL